MLPAISLIVMVETIIPHTHAARQAQEFGIISRTMPQNKLTSRIAAITGKLAVTLAALLAVTPLFGDTAEIDIAALAAATNQFTSECKIATTNGWTLCDIDSYSEKNGAANIRINRNVKDEYIDSPTFYHPIIRIELKVKSSGQTGRKLALIPIYNGSPTADTNLWARCEYSPTKDTYVPQTNFFPRSAEVHAFRMALDDGGGSTGWGVSMITIITDDSPQLTPPSELHADNIKGTRFALSWTNPENAVSNRIAVSHIKAFAESGRILDSYDFMSLTNTSKNANDNGVYDKSTLQMIDYPAFSGTNIYAAGFSTGVVQISSPDHQGYLRYDFTSIRNTLDEVANVSMLVSAKKHSTDVTGTGIWNLEVTQFDDDDTASQTTNVVLDSEFPTSPYSILIKEPLACKSVVLRPSGTRATNRRILIDTIAFIRDYVSAHAETNLVKTAFKSDSTTYSVRGLSPRTEYVATITAFDAEGNESSPSEPLAVTTNGEAIPFSSRIQ